MSWIGIFQLNGADSLKSKRLKAIDWILGREPFDWMIYISGQDYPIMPLSRIEDFLDKTEYDGFVSAHRTDAAVLPEEVFPRWYFYHWYFYRIYKFKIPPRLYRLIPIIKRKHESRVSLGETARRVQPNQTLPLLRIKYSRPGRHVMLCLRRLSNPFNSDLHCYHGPSWWTLSYRAIHAVRQFIRENPDYLRYYKRTHLPEESFFLTILMNNSSLKICNDNKRYVRWNQKPAPHPAVLTAADFPQIVSSECHFARKINQAIDKTLFDLLDQHIGVTPQHGNRQSQAVNDAANAKRRLEKT